MSNKKTEVTLLLGRGNDTIYPLLQIKSASTNHDLQDLLLQDSFKFVFECGFMKPAAFVKLSDIPTITKQVCMDYVLVRSSLEMDQFCKGLETHNILHLIRTSKYAVKKLYVHDFQGSVTVQSLFELLTPEFSPRGSNIREEEEAVVMNWHDYLKDIEGNSLTCIV